MDLFCRLLIVCNLFCTYLTRFIFAYAFIIVAGLANNGDREFVRAFQFIDGIIHTR